MLLHIFSLIKSKKIIWFFRGNGRIEKGTYSYGFSKNALIVGNIVYLKYKVEQRFVDSLRTRDMRFLLPYKHPHIVSFDYNNLIIAEDRIFGISFNATLNTLIKLLRKYTSSFKTNVFYNAEIKLLNKKQKVVYCVQHGDFQPENFLIDNDIQVFDLDNINFFPLFYDVFFLVFLHFKNDEIEYLFLSKTLEKSFNELLKNCGIHVEETLFDVYLYVFCKELLSEKNLYNRFLYAKRIRDLNYIFSKFLNQDLAILINKETEILTQNSSNYN